jgi:hypothetical protein
VFYLEGSVYLHFLRILWEKRPDWVQQTTKRVAYRQHTLEAQSWQKNYAGSKRLDVEFKVGEQIF